ncbi:MAG: restriction endonuclease subunit R, partial [Acetobacteraceae bacterium]
ALTHIRSRPWLEQMVARATRVDPWGGPYAAQRALVFHPDDPFFAKFRERMEVEQGTLARRPRLRRQGRLALAMEGDREDGAIVPLESNALALRYTTLAPGPELGTLRPEWQEAAAESAEPPRLVERRLRARIGEMVATQVVEDAVDLRAPRGQGTYHAYNAALKRALGGKSRAEMTLAELEAAVAWLERNRIGDHLHLLEGDHRYGWAARRRAGRDWRPPQGHRAATR